MTLPGGPLDPSYPSYPRSHDHPGLPSRDGRPPNRTAANWALGLSLVPCGISLIAALVTAIVVLARRDDGLDHGKRRAVAALCIVGGWALVVGGIALALTLSGPDRDQGGRLTAGGRSAVLDLQVGDCLPDDPGTGTAYAVDVAPCEEPHLGEVFATYDLEGDWTSRSEVGHVAEIGCVDRFADYAGVALRRAALDVVYFVPVDERTFRADPSVVCIGLTDTPVTTSLKDVTPRRPGGGRGGEDQAPAQQTSEVALLRD